MTTSMHQVTFISAIRYSWHGPCQRYHTLLLLRTLQKKITDLVAALPSIKPTYIFLELSQAIESEQTKQPSAACEGRELICLFFPPQHSRQIYCKLATVTMPIMCHL